MYESFTDIPRSERVAVVSKMLRDARGRVTRLEKRDIEAPALEALNRYIKGRERSGVLPENSTIRTFNPKTASFNELESMFWLLKDFMDLKTSTVTGAKKWEKNVIKGVGKALGQDPGFFKDLTDDEKKKFWEVYRTVQKDPRFEAWLMSRSKEGSGDLIPAFAKVLARSNQYGPAINRTEDSLVRSLTKQLEKAYLNV